MRKPFLPFTLMIVAGCLYLLTGSLPAVPLPMDAPAAPQPFFQLTPAPTRMAELSAYLGQACADPSQVFTSYPAKCLSTDGELIVIGPRSQPWYVNPER